MIYNYQANQKVVHQFATSKLLNIPLSTVAFVV